MASAHHSSYAAESRAYADFFSGHALAALLDQSFTIDQSRSLQELFMAHHAYMYRWVYDVETNMESRLEELRDRQNRTEKENVKNDLKMENIRGNMLAISRKVDECHLPGMRHDPGEWSRGAYRVVCI